MRHDLGIAVSSCSLRIFFALEPELPSDAIDESHDAPVILTIGNFGVANLEEVWPGTGHTP
jgi:hypothetical protein